jgi:hypothetical protein
MGLLHICNLYEVCLTSAKAIYSGWAFDFDFDLQIVPLVNVRVVINNSYLLDCTCSAQNFPLPLDMDLML